MEDSMKAWKHVFQEMTYVRILALGYLAVILLGAALLTLPIASANGKSIGYFQALFTATSATCVTGLVVLDTGTAFSVFGQIIILLMIQVGGLGFMSLGVLLALCMHKQISLRTRGLLQESMNSMQIGGVVRLVKTALCGTMIIEGAGAVLLAFRFIPVFGPVKGIYFSIFHSISAFCNAGFDLMGGYSGEYSSFVAFEDDILINAVLMLLIILGGIGFFVWQDIMKKKLAFRKYVLHTKLVLCSTSFLILFGTLLFYFFERKNLLQGMSGKEQILAVLFSSVTARTAGFNTIDTGGLTTASKLFNGVLMFIGGSPGSTAGGVKTVTVMVLLTYVWSSLRGQKGIQIMGRRLEEDAVKKASNVLLISLILAVMSVIAISYIQPRLPIEDVIFEVLSAIGTVGMSTGITRKLNSASQIIIILLMYCGRIGSMSFALSFTERRKTTSTQFPEEKIIIG